MYLILAFLQSKHFSKDSNHQPGRCSGPAIELVSSTIKNLTKTTLNRDLQKISEWAHKWEISFNPDVNRKAHANFKKFFVSYHPHRKTKSHPGGQYFFYLIQTKYYFLFQTLPSR